MEGSILSSYGEMNNQIWSGAQPTPNPRSRSTNSNNIENLQYDSNARTLASKYGVSISTVAWEDTGRTKGSCFGPNISDMTLCASSRNMPIIRKPNFSDVTSDQDISSFNVNVGNENGSALKQIPLTEYLENITKYTDIKIKDNGNLIRNRDTQILTSAQACVLPLKDGKVEFGVKLYNYQSQINPAVLVIIVSSQGTSAHYVLGRDNTLDFNKNGLKAKFLAERLRDDRAKRGVPLDGPMSDDEKIRNALMIFQIPLKYNAPSRGWTFNDDEEAGGAGFSLDNLVEKSCCLSATSDCMPQSTKYYKSSNQSSSWFGSGFGSAPAPAAAAGSAYSVASASRFTDNRFPSRSASPPRGMDHGILSTSEGSGKYNSLSNFTVERDERMPIRCTIQYYHVTDDVTVSEEDMKTIASEVVRHNPISSLVVDKTERPTEHSVVTPSLVKKMFNML
jgi:hypothetical protein